jgi:hypothetical protein
MIDDKDPEVLKAVIVSMWFDKLRDQFGDWLENVCPMKDKFPHFMGHYINHRIEEFNEQDKEATPGYKAMIKEQAQFLRNIADVMEQSINGTFDCRQHKTAIMDKKGLQEKEPANKPSGDVGAVEWPEYLDFGDDKESINKLKEEILLRFPETTLTKKSVAVALKCKEESAEMALNDLASTGSIKAVQAGSKTVYMTHRKQVQ